MQVPVYDNHIHMSPSGRNVDALREYEAAGGTGLTLVTLPYAEAPVSEGADFLKSYRIALSLADRARERTGLEVNVAVGPYPVLIVPLAERFGLERAEAIMVEGMEAAAELVGRGEANALGEVGRPHFPVPPEVREASDRVLLRGMELARENDCPVVVHCESEEGTFRELAALAAEAGLDPGKVVKHSSPPVAPELDCGVMPSLPASRKIVREMLRRTRRFMLETDYIDDPSKPGAIMSVNTVPKRVRAFLASGEMTEEDVCRICGDIPASLYSRR